MSNRNTILIVALLVAALAGLSNRSTAIDGARYSSGAHALQIEEARAPLEWRAPMTAVEQPHQVTVTAGRCRPSPRSCPDCRR